MNIYQKAVVGLVIIHCCVWFGRVVRANPPRMEADELPFRIFVNCFNLDTFPGDDSFAL